MTYKIKISIKKAKKSLTPQDIYVRNKCNLM